MLRLLHDDILKDIPTYYSPATDKPETLDEIERFRRKG